MKLKVKIGKPTTIKARLKKPDKLRVRFGNVSVTTEGYRPPTYEGEYVITPSTTEKQTLKTAQTFLENDVTVLKIPYYEVSNNTDGTTVYIGNEV